MEGLEGLDPALAPAPGHDGFGGHGERLGGQAAGEPVQEARRASGGQGDVDLPAGDPQVLPGNRAAQAGHRRLLGGEHVAAPHPLGAGGHDVEAQPRGHAPIGQGLDQVQEAVEARAIGRVQAPEVEDPRRRLRGRRARRSSKPSRLGSRSPGPDRHGLHPRLAQAVEDAGAQLRAVQEDQPRRVSFRPEGWGRQGRGLPAGDPEPVRQGPAPAQLSAGSGGGRRGERTGLDPEALALERIGGERHAPAALAGVEGGPVDRHPGDPQPPEGGEPVAARRVRGSRSSRTA